MSKPSDLELLTIERACERPIYRVLRDHRHAAGRKAARPVHRRRHVRTPITAATTIVSGRDTIVKSFEARPTGKVARHTCSNVRITVESAERATGYHRVALYMGLEHGSP